MDSFACILFLCLFNIGDDRLENTFGTALAAFRSWEGGRDTVTGTARATSLHLVCEIDLLVGVSCI